MKIGLDLDGTVYAYPEFFRDLIASFSALGHEFYCTSSHGRGEWDADCVRLNSVGIDSSLVSPSMMYPERHGDIRKKAAQADKLDLVFDDDARIQQFTKTPVFCPGNAKERKYNYAK